MFSLANTHLLTYMVKKVLRIQITIHLHEEEFLQDNIIFESR